MELWIFLFCFLIVGFANVANDSIQTIGPLLAASRRRPWWAIFLFIAGLLVAGMSIGWWLNGGDPSFGRLERFGSHEAVDWQWFHLLPPLALLVLTWLGYPVSATFLILGVFRPENLADMLEKSVLGYFLALAVGFGVYTLALRRWEARWASSSAPPGRLWHVALWAGTGWLYLNWFRQDMATQFIFLPRPLDAGPFALALAYLTAVMAVIIYRRGGRIQKIVEEKSNSEDPRSAAIISFLYGSVFFALLEYSNLPMSSTWVFIGMLAGRELALRQSAGASGLGGPLSRVGRDLRKALVALGVSVLLVLLFDALETPA